MYTRYAELRNEKGLTDFHVSQVTGIATSTFTDWKKGTCKPKVEKLLKIAKVLECPLEALIEGR